LSDNGSARTKKRRPLRVLLVEDSPDDADLVLLELRRCGYDVDHLRVDSADAMRAALRERAWDLVLSDFALPRFSANDALAVFQETGIDIPFLIVSGTIGEETAVEALKAGAHDFLVKGRLARLQPAIDRELREAEGRRRQRQAEEALRTSEERFRAIMETASDAIVSADAEGRVVYVNPAAATMFGWGPEELAGESVARLVPERFRSPGEGGFARYLGTTAELVGVRRGGDEFPMDLSLAAWRSEDRQFFTAIIRDVSERKKMEARLLVSDRMASVGTLAAGVAHEINNPLAALLANLDFASDDLGRLSKEMGSARGLLDGGLEDLRDAREAAERIRNIVKDLKLFSRGEEDTRDVVDIERVLESSLRLASTEIRHRARLEKRYGSVRAVDGNESRLGQVFLNLIVNAAQAIPEGRAEENEIRVATFTAGDGRVVVEIRDSGSGMSPEVVSQLFTPFFTTKPLGVGTGLGLSICHRIITGLGGEITVDSQVGQGTTFRVYLPPANVVGPAAPSPSPAPRTRTSSRRGHILVVDDEPAVARAVRRALSDEHEVVTAGSADEALARIKAGERFDVILCDLMMPQTTGMDLFEDLARLAADQAGRMVFLTGGAFTQRARTFLDQVRNPRLEKPFDSQILREVVNERVSDRNGATHR
jgi:PAS domain S-box-containing protein